MFNNQCSIFRLIGIEKLFELITKKGLCGKVDKHFL